MKISGKYTFCSRRKGACFWQGSCHSGRRAVIAFGRRIETPRRHIGSRCDWPCPRYQESPRDPAGPWAPNRRVSASSWSGGSLWGNSLVHWRMTWWAGDGASVVAQRHNATDLVSPVDWPVAHPNKRPECGFPLPRSSQYLGFQSSGTDYIMSTGPPSWNIP